LDGAICNAADVSRRVSDEVFWVWYVSPEVPNTIITYGPSGQTTDNSPTFRWTGVGGMPPYQYRYRIAGGGWSNWDPQASDSFTLSPGTYVFEVRAREQNNNNNFDPTPARRTFTIVDPSHPPYSAVSPPNLYKYSREIGE